MKDFELYLEELSNWYIRRNRRRFWKSEDDEDKKSAYATLYHVLENIIKMIAPVLPFASESIYQNLIRNSDSNSPESIHLCDFPISDENYMDTDLIKNVDALKKCVELGRSARNISDVRIRQPLSKMLFALEDDLISSFIFNNQDIILDELNVKSIERITEADRLINYKIKPNLRTLGQKYGKGLSEIKKIIEESNVNEMVKELKDKNFISLNDNEYQLGREDVFIETIAVDGFSAVSDAGITVGLALDLNEDLILEGIVRDVVRIVQSLRKKAGFAVEDRINISWEFDGKIEEALGKFESYFKLETLTTNIEKIMNDFDYEEVIEINERQFKIKLKRNN